MTTKNESPEAAPEAAPVRKRDRERDRIEHAATQEARDRGMPLDHARSYAHLVADRQLKVDYWKRPDR